MRPQLVQDRQRHLVVADQDRLGNFKFELARRKPGFRERRGDLQGKGVISELNRRHVDRQLDVLRPGRRLGTGLGEHPFSELADQAAVFRDRYEFGRRNHAAHRMMPAQQRFASRDLIVPQIDQGLVVDIESAFTEPAVCDHPPHILFEHAAGLDAGVHVALEEAIGPPPVGLGAVHGKVGVFQQLIEIGAILEAPAPCRCWRRSKADDQDTQRVRASPNRSAR